MTSKANWNRLTSFDWFEIQLKSVLAVKAKKIGGIRFEVATFAT